MFNLVSDFRAFLLTAIQIRYFFKQFFFIYSRLNKKRTTDWLSFKLGLNHTWSYLSYLNPQYILVNYEWNNSNNEIAKYLLIT